MAGYLDIFFIQNYHFLNPYSIPHIITAFLLAFLGIFMIYKNPKKRINWVFGSAILSISWWLAFNSLAYNTILGSLAQKLFTLGIVGVFMIPAFLFHYVFLLTEKRYVKIAYLNYFVTIFFTVILFSTDLMISGVYRYFWGYYLKASEFFIYQMIWVSGFILISFVLVLHFYLTKRNELNRIKANQIKYFIVGFFIAIFALTDYLPDFGIEFYPMGFFFLTIFAFFLSYTIIRFRFMDIETVFHKTLAYTISSLGMLLLIFGLIFIILQWVRPFDTLTIAFFALFMMYIGTWYRGKIQPYINRIFMRKSFEYQKKVSRLIEELSIIYDKKLFADTLLKGIFNIFFIRNSIFMEKDGEGFRVLSVGKRNRIADIHIDSIKSNHPIIRILNKGELIVDSSELEYKGSSDNKTALHWFKKNEIEIVVSIRNAGQVIGFLGLGNKENLRHYSSEEINIFEKMVFRLGNELNDTIMHEKLLEKERRMRVEVEKQVKVRTRDLLSTKQRLIKTMKDVADTNLKLSKAQRALKSSYKKLKELDVKKDEFISIAAHELKTPLAAIHSFSQVLQKNKRIIKEKNSARNLRIIDTETRRLADLVTEILELSRIDLGTIKFQIEKVSVAEVMGSVMKEAGVKAREKHLKLKCYAGKGVQYIETDKERFIQILINLADNAIKFTPKGEISCSSVVEGDCVHFIVKDTGIGVPKKDIEKIFDRFYQVDSSYTREGMGTGLGLSLVKEYLDKLGGKVWVKSAPGSGSEFHFTLPVKASPELKHQHKIRK